MKFLLFLLGVSFFFIFFLFSKYLEVKGSFFQNLFWEGNLYVFFVILVIILISGREDPKKVEVKNVTFKKISLGVKQALKVFFNEYIYYLALVFFYIGFFLLCKALFGNIELSYIFLFSNVSIIFLSIFEEKLPFVSSLIRVNTSFISLYYIVAHILFLFGIGTIPGYIDVLNIISLMILWYRFLYVSSEIFHKNIFYIYVYFFFFIEMCVIGNIFFSGSIFMYGILSFLVGSGLLLFTDSLNRYISFPKNISRGVGVIYLCVTILLLYFQLSSLVFLSVLYSFFVIISSYILFAFHARFKNYIALFFSFSGYIGAFVMIYLYILDFDVWENVLLGIILVASYILPFLHKILISTDLNDRYFFQVYSFFVNLISSLWFFFFTDFSILQVSLFFLAESLYLLLIYYNFKILRNA